jgi:hypothetical protein
MFIVEIIKTMHIFEPLLYIKHCCKFVHFVRYFYYVNWYIYSGLSGHIKGSQKIAANVELSC